MALSEGELLREVERRWWYDPEFHAKVATAVAIVGVDLWVRTGRYLSTPDQGLATLAAAVALVVAEHPSA